MIKKVKIVFKHKRSFFTEKKEVMKIKPESHKKFNDILGDLINQEDNPYLDELFNNLVLQRSGEKEEMMFL